MSTFYHSNRALIFDHGNIAFHHHCTTATEQVHLKPEQHRIFNRIEKHDLLASNHNNHVITATLGMRSLGKKEKKGPEFCQH